MKVKRFTAPSMQKALRQVSEELGPDAVILSNHRVPQGVELVAAIQHQGDTLSAEEDHQEQRKSPLEEALDRERHFNRASNPDPRQSRSTSSRNNYHANESSRIEQPPEATIDYDRVEAILAGASKDDEQETLRRALDEAKAKRSKPNESPSQSSSVSQNPSSTTANQQAQAQGYHASIDQDLDRQQKAAASPLSDKNTYNHADIDDMRDELKYLKKALMNQNSPSFHWRPYAPNNAMQARCWKELEGLGFSDEMAYHLLHQYDDKESEESIWNKLRARLIAGLAIDKGTLFGRQSRTALVGPTGSGKTTTIAKLATKMVMKYGSDAVALITTDNYCIAGHDELKTIGKILGVRVRFVDSDHPLDQVLSQLQEVPHVLIDTAGLTSDGPLLTEQLSQLVSSKFAIKLMLTLPATAQPKVLQRQIDSYKAAAPNNLILTKLDEVDSLGETLSVLINAKIPLAYLSTGQRVPDDLKRAEGSQLIDQALKGRVMNYSNHKMAGTL